MTHHKKSVKRHLTKARAALQRSDEAGGGEFEQSELRAAVSEVIQALEKKGQAHDAKG